MSMQMGLMINLQTSTGKENNSHAKETTIYIQV